MNRVQLSTFLRWETRGKIGYKTEKINSQDMVTEIWCKICAKHAHEVVKSLGLRGQAVKDFEKYVKGTCFITKHTVMRHFKSNAHEAGERLELLLGNDSDNLSQSGSREPGDIQNNNNNSCGIGTQPRINTTLHNAARNAYRKLIKTAYFLAARGQPLSAFKTCVEIQKSNGVQLISGADSGKKAGEFVAELSKAIRVKITQGIRHSSFFSILSDGSQARKTNSEKELVLVRLIRNGKAVFYAAGLENIDDYGTASADNIKKSIDSVFQNEHKINIPEEIFSKCLVSMTADGAAVNTGKYNGVLTQFKADRPWLIATHCVSHRLELAMKDSLLKTPQFATVKDFMISLYYYCKNSGKFVRNLNSTAEALGAQAYKFPKVHGTRFLNHTRRGMSTLLHNWPILIQSIENTLASEGRQDPKLIGYLKKLKNSNFLEQCCLFQQLVEKVAVLSLIFEKDNLFAFEIGPSVSETISGLEDLVNEDLWENSGFSVQNSDGILSCKRHKSGHKKRQFHNREYVEITNSGMSQMSPDRDIHGLKSKAIADMITCIRERFDTFDIHNHLFCNSQWLDSANWREDITEELKAIHYIADHFSVPLEARGFEIKNVKQEWKSIKRAVNNFYSNFKANEFWSKILQHRRKQFPNMCIIVDLLLCLGPSNSSVESSFSHLSCMLTDSRLSTAHKTMENLLMIKVNDHIWDLKEREEIIEAALHSFMSTRRKTQLMSDLDTDTLSLPRSEPASVSQITIDTDTSSSSGEDSECSEMDVDTEST